MVELQKFVEILRANPSVVHLPELSFFKQYLLDLGARLPSEKTSQKDEELDSGRMEPEEGFVKSTTSRSNRTDLSDEEMEKVASLKTQSAEAVEKGHFEEALGLLDAAIDIGGVSAMMLTKRADLLLKLRRPLAAIADCDEALFLNPDSGKAFRIRGLAHRALHHWEEAHFDLGTAQTIDFDETVEAEKKFVDSKWKSTVKAASPRVEEAQNAPSFAGMPDLGGLFSDPEIMGAMGNPKVMAAMQAMMTNPAAFLQYQNDPEVGPVLMKLMSKMGGVH